ncbi:small glutamine-rich tetratricopeptide repeat-containing protein beta [Phtheirospermum japonicum]|uniref:Small glutamine-rich tetratricopeptide repeat-containing protein beta n=1 Tax=Phtheirospermum japonicum TaxID=374723 RepID=A0A830BUY7_9LAMI|nr:small glutamine-rich tetratricopeptide repeat-containing protein beta [Phtheirospermum japonicum]
MANLKTDSPFSRRIARSFLQFLNSVEPSAGVDSEALDVAKECLAEVFKIDQSSINGQSNCDSLVDIFRSYESNANNVVDNGGVSDAPISSSQNNAEIPEVSRSLDQDRTTEPHSLGKDELFGQFFGALEKIHYFSRMADGNDDQSQLDRATHLFHNAVEEMQKAGCQKFDQKSLAETFKSQGNKAMQSKRYVEAIELYTFATALCEDNAVYYCNRAAAYTQIRRYTEAVQDCLRSIQINPNYSKGYSRLGFAYYCQGRYRDAIDKGYLKALQLDPNNESVKENIRVAEQKLREEQQWGGPGQSSNSTSHGYFNFQHGGGSGSNSTSSMPFNINGANLSSMFMNMAGNAFQGHEGSDLESEDGAARDDEPGVRIGGNINFNVNDLPEELSGAFRSMMEMFPGATSNGNQQQDNSNNGRSTAS